jgi:hypothetical protein
VGIVVQVGAVGLMIADSEASVEKVSKMQSRGHYRRNNAAGDEVKAFFTTGWDHLREFGEEVGENFKDIYLRDVQPTTKPTDLDVDQLEIESGKDLDLCDDIGNYLFIYFFPFHL